MHAWYCALINQFTKASFSLLVILPGPGLMRLVQRLVSLVTLVSLLVSGLTAGHRGNIWLVTGTGVMALAANMARSLTVTVESSNVNLLLENLWDFNLPLNFTPPPDYYDLTLSYLTLKRYLSSKSYIWCWVGDDWWWANQIQNKVQVLKFPRVYRSCGITMSLTIVHVIMHHCRCADEDNLLNIDIINYLLMTSNVLLMKGKLYNCALLNVLGRRWYW